MEAIAWGFTGEIAIRSRSTDTSPPGPHGTLVALGPWAQLSELILLKYSSALEGRPSLKTVLLLRHAKSSWDHPNLTDFRRPLAPRGQKAAPRIGGYMAKSGLKPDLVLCSAATRAMETWELVAESLPEDPPVEFREDLYHASPWSLMAILRGLSPTVNTVLLVGHNPTFEDLAISLVGTGPPGAVEEIHRKYPTGALAILDFLVETWPAVGEGTGHLRDFIQPRQLKSP